MKLTLTIALTFIVSVGMAQISLKKQKLNISNSNTISLRDSTIWAKTDKPYTFQTLTFSPSSWIVVGNNGDKPLLSFDRYPTNQNKPIESVTIHVKRSNIVWLNDSTLAVKP